MLMGLRFLRFWLKSEMSQIMIYLDSIGYFENLYASGAPIYRNIQQKRPQTKK